MPPALSIQIPAHGLGNALFESDPGLPAQRVTDLGRVDGIAPVMSGPVGHVGDLPGIGCLVLARAQLIKGGADRADNLDVASFGIAAAEQGQRRLPNLNEGGLNEDPEPNI